MKGLLVLLFSTFSGALFAQPVFTSTPVTDAQVNESYAYQVTITDDPAPQNVNFALAEEIPGLTLTPVNATEATLEGVPEQAGIFTVTIRATNEDDGEFAEQSFQLDITKGSAVISLTSLNQEYSDTPLSVNYATEPAGLNVFISYDGSPDPPVNAGSYAVSATVDDPDYEGSATDQFLISTKELLVSVEDISREYNQPNPAFQIIYSGFAGDDNENELDTKPTATTSATQSSNSGTYPIQVSGGADNNYRFSYETGTLTITPIGATITLTNLLFTYNGDPKSPTISTNPSGLNTMLTYNGSPELPVNAGEYQVNAVINELNYAGSAESTLTIQKAQAGITLSGLNQNFDGSPKAVTVVTEPGGLNYDVTYDGNPELPVNAGRYTVVVSISEENYTGQATGELLINSPPTADPIPEIVVDEDAPNSSVNLEAYFQDAEDDSNELIFSIAGNSNPGLFSSAAINPSNALVLDYAPNQNGSCIITIRATDSGGLYVESTVDVTVNALPDPPEFISSPITGGVQGQEYIYNVEVVDPDGEDTFSFSYALPDWLTFTDLGNGLAQISGTPGNDEVGTHVVALEVEDSDGLGDTQFFNITVGNSNDAPFFTSIPIETATENVTYTYNITTSDPDNDERTISALTLPGW
ncbi:MAG: MBG domain-containing protein, partial [Cyclobacteriaceae bacterium]